MQIIENIDDPTAQENLSSLISIIGASREAFRKKDFTGNAITRICSESHQIRG
jgi:hypothetical protein